jgi:AcrR family transcriptional regulator
MARKPTAERQEEILDAASRLLLRDGVAALTMATLADAVGVTSGALFRHFASRDAILLALAERMAARLRADLAAPVAGDAPTRLRAFIAARLGTVSRAPTAPAMVLSPDVHLALPPAGRAALAGVVRDTFAHVTAIVAAGQREGSFRDDLAPAGAAASVLGLIALQALARALPTPLNGVEVADVALSLLRPPAPKDLA